MFLIKGGLYDHSDDEPQKQFHNGTIDQAALLIIREAGRPLRVRELLVRMIEDGMVFKGNSPDISVMVSLSRNASFSMVSPATFDLTSDPLLNFYI